MNVSSEECSTCRSGPPPFSGPNVQDLAAQAGQPGQGDPCVPLFGDGRVLHAQDAPPPMSQFPPGYPAIWAFSDYADPDEGLEEKQFSTRCPICWIVWSIILCVASGYSVFSSRWAAAVIKVQPYQVFTVYKSLTSVSPPGWKAQEEEAPNNPNWKSKKEEPIFTVWTGLGAIKVTDLCEPLSDTFQGVVDKSMCRQKLSAFCKDVKLQLASRPLIPQYIQDLYVGSCLSAVEKGGVTFLPPDLESQLEEDANDEWDDDVTDSLDDDIDKFSINRGVHYCQTIVHCPAMKRCYLFRLGAKFSMMAATVLTGICAILLLFALVVKWKPGLMRKIACGGLVTSVLLIMGAMGIFLFLVMQHPAQDLIRTEDLIYYLFPDISHPVDAKQADSSLVQLSAGVVSLDMQSGKQTALPQVWGGMKRPATSVLRRAKGRSHHPLAEESRNGFDGVRDTTALQGQSAHREVARLHGRHTHAPQRGESGLLQLVEVLKVSDQKVSSVALVHRHNHSLDVSFIPDNLWVDLLMKLGGNLLQAIIAQDMSVFLKPFEVALKRAFKISKLLWDRWIQWASQNLQNVPELVKGLLPKLIGAFPDVSALKLNCESRQCPDEIINEQQGIIQASAVIHQVWEEKIQEVVGIAVKMAGLLKALASDWINVEQPVERLLMLVSEVLKSKNINALVQQQEALNRDLGVLFRFIFTKLPRRVKSLVNVGKMMLNFTRYIRPVLQQTHDALKRTFTWIENAKGYLPTAGAKMLTSESQPDGPQAPIEEAQALLFGQSSKSDEGATPPLPKTMEEFTDTAKSKIAGAIGMVYINSLMSVEAAKPAGNRGPWILTLNTTFMMMFFLTVVTLFCFLVEAVSSRK